MRRTFLTSVFIGSLAVGAQAADINSYTAPDDATPGISGDVSLYGGYLRMNDNVYSEYSGNGYVVGGAARANFWLAHNFSTQVDANAEGLRVNTDGGDWEYHMANVAGHLSWRNFNYLFGAFTSLGKLSAVSSDLWDAMFATLGVEGQAHVGPVQLYGQAGVTKQITGFDDGDSVLAYYIHGEVRNFVNPDLMVAANVGFHYEIYDGSDDPLYGVRFGADVETKLNGSYVSAVLSYQGSYDWEPSEDEYWNVHAIMAGLRVHFNDDTLQYAAMNGATLRDFNPLTGVNHNRFNDWE